jgi:hypothetical protein
MQACPICGGFTEPLPRKGDWDGFKCPVHGPVRMSGTILSTRSNATRQEWEKAFDRAKARTEPDEDPVIMDSDFL